METDYQMKVVTWWRLVTRWRLAQLLTQGGAGLLLPPGLVGGRVGTHDGAGVDVVGAAVAVLRFQPDPGVVICKPKGKALTHVVCLQGPPLAPPKCSQSVPPPVTPTGVLQSPSLCLLPSSPTGVLRSTSRALGVWAPSNCSQPVPPPVTPTGVLRSTSRASGVWAPSVALASSSMPKLAITQLCLTLCDPMGCSKTGSSLHGIFQARIQEWVAISFSTESSWPRD